MATNPFGEWLARWAGDQAHQGPHLRDEADRIRRLSALWAEPIPGDWTRGIDQQLLGPRYRRGDLERPSREHAIELGLLREPLDDVSFPYGAIVDGINAVPLVSGRVTRQGHIEADVLLLVKTEDGLEAVVIEAKTESSYAWTAAVQLLLQMRLLMERDLASELFARRRHLSDMPDRLPLRGLVLGPGALYSSPGRRTNSVAATSRLLDDFRSRFSVDARLSTWTSEVRRVDLLP